MDAEELAHRFKYHAPTGHKGVKHERVRIECHTTAVQIDQLAPDCREKSLAMTALEEAMMWANAAIARNPEVD